jgi:hypothetical protein
MTPEHLAAMRASLEALPREGDPSAAWAVLRARHGRFTEVLLRRVAEASPALAARVGMLVGGFSPQTRSGHVD